MSTNSLPKLSSAEKITSMKTRVGHNANISTVSVASTGDKTSDKGQHIQVAVRLRPLNDGEKKHGTVSVVSVNGAKREVMVREKVSAHTTKTFTYDKVFGPNSTQIEVYREVVVPILQEVLMGYNCTIFAYGQTGTGKTFTMEGERTREHVLNNSTWETDPLAGVIPRTLHQLFETLTTQQADFTIRVSFVELYNEELFDLLGADDAPSLRLYDDPVRKGSVVMQGLEEVNVRSKEEVYEILERGARKRATAATLLNAHSSRSHSVFSITVHIRETAIDGEEMLKTGKIYLVDLAGSENIGRSGAVDKRAREAGSINQSLLTLGRVITALVEHARHIPYRESKLTRLLQDSLGGRTKTSIIATISPSSGCLEETLSTLDYALRAKNITNKPEVNQKVTKKALLKEYAEEIERLRRDLQAAREKHGFYMAQENYDSMIQKMSRQEDLIKELEEKMAFVQQEGEKASVFFAKSREELTAAKCKLEKTAGKLQRARSKLIETTNNYVEVVKARDENEFLLEEHKGKEMLLHSQAEELVGISEKAVQNIQMLHGKLDRTKRVQEINEHNLGVYQEQISSHVQHMQKSLNSFCAVQQEIGTEQNRHIATLLTNAESRCAAVKDSLLTLHENFESRMMKIGAMLQEAKDDFQMQAKEILLRLDDACETVHCEARAMAEMQKKCQGLVATEEDRANEGLEKFRDMTNEFVSKEFARDQPTGSTPSKQSTNCRIPKELIRVRPHGELLDSFREQYMPPEIPIETSILEDTFNGEHVEDDGPM